MARLQLIFGAMLLSMALAAVPAMARGGFAVHGGIAPSHFSDAQKRNLRKPTPVVVVMGGSIIEYYNTYCAQRNEADEIPPYQGEDGLLYSCPLLDELQQ